MRFNGNRLSLSTVFCALAIITNPAFAQGQVAPSSQGADENNTDKLEEITVTASRRSESLQKTPIAVTAMNAALLATRQVTDSRSIVSNAPNLTGNNNVGQGSAISFYIRGIGVSDSLGTFDPSVGLYVDDVYIARQSANNFGLYDLDRIEVLRGPQGTLYGRNTNGGAIKVITAKPNDDLSGALSASYGNYDRWSVKGSINVPLSEKIFVRANGLVEKGDGYIRNLTLNTKGGDKDYAGGRIAVRLLPTETVTWDLAADYGRDIVNGAAPTDIGGLLTARPDSLFESRTGMENYSFGRSYGFQSNLAWNASDDISIESITAWRSATQRLFFDLSGQPVPLYIFDQDNTSHQFSQELKINADIGSKVRLMGGLYYFNEQYRAKDNQYVRANATAAQAAYLRNFTLDTDSYAAFGQIEYALADNLKVVAAGRYTRDTKTLDYTQVSTNAGSLFNFTDESIQALGTDFAPHRTFSKFTPKLGVNWQATPDAFFYLSWTKGFRSGGWTGRALRADQFRNFDPETVSSYEFGSKLSFFDRRIRLNSSIFYMDYANLFNTLTSNGLFIVQLADAKIYGMENELTIRATPWLDLFANGSYLHAAYKSPKPANLADQLQRAPKYQLKAGFDAHYPVASGKVVANASVFYSSSYYVTPANLAFTAPLVPVDSNHTSSYALVDGMIGYQFGNDDRYQIGLSCTNCFNKQFFDSATVVGSWAAVFSTTPRLYKVTASMKF